MKTWKLKLVRADGGPVTGKHAWVRYFLAWGSLLAAGAGFVWAQWDQDGQFLQ
jgi:uncharacterized RDD family membrane protein YckC